MLRRGAWSAGRSHAPLIILPAAFAAVFFLWPLARVVLRSVAEPRPGLANYARVLTSGPFVRVLLFTFEIAGAVTVLCLLIGYPTAALIARLHGRPAAVLTALIIASLWTSAVVRSYAWMVLFQRYGLFNQLLVGARLVEQPVRILQTSIAVEIGMVHLLLPFMMLPLIAAMRRMDRGLLRAGRVLGAGPVRLFLRVYLPLTLPAVAASVVLVFITALGFFITPSLLGGGRTIMAAMLIDDEATTYLDWPTACTLATLLLAMTLAVYAVFQLLARRPTARALR